MGSDGGTPFCWYSHPLSYQHFSNCTLFIIPHFLSHICPSPHIIHHKAQSNWYGVSWPTKYIPYQQLIIFITRYNLSSLPLSSISYNPPTELSMMVLYHDALSASKAYDSVLNSRASKCSQFLLNSSPISGLPNWIALSTALTDVWAFAHILQ